MNGVLRVLLVPVLLSPVAARAQQFPSTPPAAGPIKPAAFPPFQEAVLANGMRLVLVENSRLPVLSVTLTLPAGATSEPAAKAGLSSMVASLLTKGAGSRTADQISAAIEGVGGRLAAFSDEDFLIVRADVLSPNAKLAFGLIGDVVGRPTFPEKEVELIRTQTLSALQLELSQPGALADRFLMKGLYGAHPYSYRPTTETVKGITRADLLSFQRSRLRPTGGLLVIAGKIGFTEAKQLANEAFQGWVGNPAPTAAAPTPPMRTSTEILLVHRPGSVQSNIVVGNLTWAPADPGYYAATIANKVLGGGADARLFLILREQKSWTYGAYSRVERLRGMGNFQANTEVRTEVTDSALREVMSQLHRIRTEPVPADELDAAKGALVGRFPLEIETVDAVAQRVARAKLLGLPTDYLATYRTKLAAVTPASLTEAAQRTIRPDAAYIVVVGDGARIYDGLKDIAPTRIVSPDGSPLTLADLSAKASPVDLDLGALVPRRDSLSILVQGNAFGWQRVTLETTDSGFKFTDETQLGPVGGQKTEAYFGPTAAMQHVVQSGTMQGQKMSIDVAFAGGRAKGSATTPGPQGMKTVNIDQVVEPATIDDNALQAIFPALKWAPGAKWTINVFSSGQGETHATILAVAGIESVTVPAGTFEAYKVDATGGPAPITFWVMKDKPHRVVKLAIVGQPVEFVLVK